MQLSQGTLLQGGKYKIERVLGQGSFGITYLAEHTSLGNKVAIKEFFMKELNTRGEDGSITGMSDDSLSHNYGQKFKREAMNLCQLDHPNIVRVTDLFDENGTYYYVMNYIEGENLNEYLKHTTVQQNEALDIIKSVSKALMYMHDEKHILHLDLKPGNIMRRASDGHIFLIDFGLSKHYSSDGQPETSTSIGLGTPGYAPTEQGNQAKSGEFRPTIDVYALGATLFKLLTRETPPHASEIVSDDELIEERLRANGIASNIIDIVVNAMLPNVKKRTPTVKAFVEAVESISTPSDFNLPPIPIHTKEVETVNEETCIIGSSSSSTENLAGENINDENNGNIPPPPIPPITPVPPAPPTYLVFAVISFCCCWITGIPAIIYSGKVETQYKSGNYDASLKSSQKALLWSNWGIIIGIVLFLFYFGMIILL